MIKKILFLLFCIPGLVLAQKPIILVVPFGPGGPADQLGKVVQKTLSQELNRPVILDYKPGAGGDIANSYVANWTRDETVLLIQGSALATNQALNPSNYNRSALVPVIYMGSMPLVLIVPNKSKLQNFKSWQLLNSQMPVTWGSAGMGSSSHIYGEVFKNKIQKNLIHVPYKGIAQIMPDLIAGHIDSAFVFVSTVEPFINTHQLWPVAVASAQRLKNLPSVPTFRELGMSGMDYYSWFVLLGNQNGSAIDHQKIQTTMMKILSSKNTVQLFEQAGLEVNAQLIDQSFILKEVHRYQEVIKIIKLQD